MGKRKNLVVDLAKDNFYSNNEKTKEIYKPSKFEKVINYLLCRSDLANQELSVKPVPFVQLFRYAERIDVVLLIIGSILAAISGILQTAQEVIVGHLTNTMIVYNTTSDEFYDKAMLDVWLLGGLGVFALFTHFVQYMSFQYCCVRITSKIKQEYIRSILRQNAEWLDRNHSGVLTTKLHDNIERINEGIGDKLGVLIRGIVMFTSGIGFSFYYDWRLTLSIIGIGPLCCICMSLMSRSSDSFAAKEFDGLGKAGSIAEEALMGVRTVQAFNGQEEMAEKYTTQLGQGRMFAVRKGFWEGVFGGLLFFFMFLFCGIGTYYGALLLYWRVIDNPGTVFIVITSTLMGAYFLGLISPHLEVVLNARVAAATVYEIIDRVPEIDAYSSAGRNIEKVKGKILFDNVTFRYATRKDTTVLDGFSLTIEPGTSVALVGHSGCGKSTCISLLERLYEQEAGRVLIDGVDIRELNIGWLRKVVGIVQQEPVIFHDTITNNLLIGNPDAMQQDIVEACKMANAHDFIMKLPRGYDTMIGDGGVQLSGGQKQRIAIARTLIRDPKILLLDEATSALDAHSESVVQSALGKASKGRTTVVVAHRLSTIREADKIVFLENGVIVECGNHEELVKFGGRYAKLVESQKFKDLDCAENEEHRHRYSRQSSTKSYESRKSIDLDSCSSDETLTDLSKIQQKMPEDESISTGYMDIIRNAHGNYHYLITGTIFAVIRGSELALWSVMFGYMFHAFTLPMDQMMDEVFLIFLVYGLLGLLVFVTQVASTTLFSIVAENLCLKFRVEALKNLLYQDASFYDNPAHTPGKLITRLATDAPNVKAVMDSRMLNFISSANSVWMNLIFGYYYSWQISLVGTVLLIAFALFVLGIASLIAKENLKQIKHDEAGKISIEIIENVKTIQLLTGSSRFLDCYANAIHSQYRSVTINATLNSSNSSMAQTFMFFSMFICYAAGIPLIFYEIVDATSAYRAINAMMMGSVGVMNSSHNFQEFIKAKTAAGMLFKLIYQKPNTGDVMEGSNNKIKGNVSFDSVKFCYPQRPMHEVMSNLCLPIKSGQSIALVGPSGAGKSTCIAMLERFYDVSGGALCIDGEDIRNMSLHNLRTQMALVGQEPRLFAGTIKENVCFGLKNVPMEQVNHALELANATKFLANLPMGMDTEVGEKGSQLSGGQKQRIAIARALVRNPKILLLDEATSALDSESERAVQQALDRAREGRTCITIAHRLSSIQNADVIFYIDNGIVQEFGSHSYLMTKRGKYYGLTRKQDLTA